MKLVYIIMGILILIIVLNFTSIYKKNNLVNSETLVKAFNSTGAKIINYEIYFFGTLGDDFNNLEDLRNLSNNFVSDMNINNKKLINNEMDNNDIKKIDIDGVSSDGRIIKLSFVIQKNNDKTNTGQCPVNTEHSSSNTTESKNRGQYRNKKNHHDPCQHIKLSCLHRGCDMSNAGDPHSWEPNAPPISGAWGSLLAFVLLPGSRCSD